MVTKFPPENPMLNFFLSFRQISPKNAPNQGNVKHAPPPPENPCLTFSWVLDRFLKNAPNQGNVKHAGHRENEMLNMLNMLDFLGEPRAVALTGVLPESLTCLTCLAFLGKC